MQDKHRTNSCFCFCSGIKIPFFSSSADVNFRHNDDIFRSARLPMQIGMITSSCSSSPNIPPIQNKEIKELETYH